MSFYNYIESCFHFLPVKIIRSWISNEGEKKIQQLLWKEISEAIFKITSSSSSSSHTREMKNYIVIGTVCENKLVNPAKLPNLGMTRNRAK